MIDYRPCYPAAGGIGRRREKARHIVFLQLGKAADEPNPISSREPSLNFFQHIIDRMTAKPFSREIGHSDGSADSAILGNVIHRAAPL